MNNYTNNRFEIQVDAKNDRVDIYAWLDTFPNHQDRLTVTLEGLDKLRDAINNLDNKRE